MDRLLIRELTVQIQKGGARYLLAAGFIRESGVFLSSRARMSRVIRAGVGGVYE